MTRSLVLTLWMSLWMSLTTALWAAEEPDPSPPTNRPNPETLRGRFRVLNRDDRESRLRELRGRLNDNTNRTEIEKRREEWRKLSPAEREARIKEFRERNLSPGSPRFNRLTPAERETKRSELKSRLDGQIKELESRRSTTALSPVEERRLDRFRRMSRRLAEGTALGPDRRLSPPREGVDLPPPRTEAAPKP